MKPIARIKAYHNQGLFKDIGFLLIAVGFLLVKAFDQPLQSALLYAPLIVAGVFISLVVIAHALVAMLHLLDLIGERLGMRRLPRR